jgi:Golgi SNAP receptor complex protein 2
MLGQINTSLLSFSRTIEDYNKLAKQELVPDKQTKAYDRIKNFRTELSDYRDRFEKLKHETEEKVSNSGYSRGTTCRLLLHHFRDQSLAKARR